MTKSKHQLLYIEDKVGVTPGYLPLFEGLLTRAGFDQTSYRRFSIYRRYATTPFLVKFNHNRKALTWDPKKIRIIKDAAEEILLRLEPTVVMCACPAMIGILDLDPEWATLDNLRGGVYYPFKSIPETPLVVTLPISAWHRQVKEKDLAAANKGFTDQEDFTDYYARKADEYEAAKAAKLDGTSENGVVIDNETGEELDERPDYDEDQMWYEPLAVPYGRFVIKADLNKAHRLMLARKV